ncbi:MAG: ribosome small subunit-dependent GTPase A [Bacilli bacterium]|nr:ribosome small subunit-dependent GTPase A [Bacilli bacterium]MDD4733911.1 ribosome small subunit-dependent GTPase A [Bacilli bacterium]
MIGKIIKNISNDYTVLVEDKKYVCKPRGKFRNQNQTPLVGDIVKIDVENQYILEILPRKNELTRPPVVNIDQVIILVSTKNPDFDTNLLDKLLVIIEYNNILPIICMSKTDLLNEKELKEIEIYKNYYQKIGYKVFFNNELDKIKEILENKITVFTGQSGSGKSTLLNKLDENLNLKTNEISLTLGRGKHTTRHTELLNVCKGWVADTPGFSAIDINILTNEQIRDNFVEFNLYRDECKYRDCNHIKEDHCIIKEKVNNKEILISRYNNYLKFINK